MTGPDAIAAVDEITPRVLHAQATDGERRQLAGLLAGSPGCRRRFLDHAMLHGALSREAKAGAFAGDRAGFFRAMDSRPGVRPRRMIRVWLAAAATIAALLVAIPLVPSRASAAIDRMIVAMDKPVDRTYRIEVITPASSSDPAPARPDRGRFPVAGSLDGAMLWLRGPGQFVLRQRLPNGETRLLGSDGAESWSIRGGEAPHVSEDPSRFGGGLFAKRREIAFLDLRSQLDELRTFYQTRWLDRSGPGLWKLLGTRKSADQGGPGEIELWFRPDSGLIESMVLRQLPRENGGPRDIRIVLESGAPLPADFFSHTHHHPPEGANHQSNDK